MSKTQECPYPIYPEESTNEKAAFLQRSTAIKRGTEQPTRTILELSEKVHQGPSMSWDFQDGKPYVTGRTWNLCF